MLPKNAHPKTHDLTGNKYGQLTAIRYKGRRKRQTIWQCKCDCGKIANYQASNLTAGKTTRCANCQYEDKVRRLTHMRHNRREIKIRYKGATHTLKEWASITGIPHRRIYGRYCRGEKPNKILTPGKHSTTNCKARTITFRGITRTIKEWANSLHITRQALHARLQSQTWTKRDALTYPNTWN